MRKTIKRTMAMLLAALIFMGGGTSLLTVENKAFAESSPAEEDARMATKGITVFTQNGEDFTINDPNVANEFSTGMAYAIGDHVTYQGNLYVFTAAHSAGAWNAAHVTQVTIGGELKEKEQEISDLKSAMNDIDSDFRIEDKYVEDALGVNFVQKTFRPTDSFNEKIDFFANNGDTIIVNVSGAGLSASSLTIYFWYAGASSGTNRGTIPIGQDQSYTLNGDIVAIEFYTIEVVSGQPIAVKAWTETDFNVAKAVSDVVEKKQTSIRPDFSGLASGYVNKQGEIIEDSSYYYNGTKISVIPGDVITRDNDAAIRMICAYNGDTVNSSAGTNSETTSYTVPDGVDGVILTISANSLSAAQTAFESVLVSHSYNNEYIIKKSMVEETVDEVLSKYEPRNVQSYRWNGTIATGQTFDTNFGIAPKKGFRAGFSGKFSGAFDKVTLQIDAYSPNRIIVDGTNITIQSRYNSDVVVPHELTITKDIYISVVADECDGVKVIVSSNGSQKSITGVFWVTAYETFKIINGNQTMTNAILTIGCGTIDHRIWVIGDSYISMDSDQRWPYYMDQNGFTKNVMFCGSSGSGKDASEIWIHSLLQIGTPKTILWCMGMNYTPDYERAPYLASDWKDQVDWLMTYCTEHGIELVFGTIPSVPGSGSVSARRHEHKNQYIKESGFRYIDFAAAVGATVDEQGNVSWADGMLAPDGVHPSAKGAIALFNMAITSMPELTYDYQ